MKIKVAITGKHKPLIRMFLPNVRMVEVIVNTWLFELSKEKLDALCKWLDAEGFYHSNIITY